MSPQLICSQTPPSWRGRENTAKRFAEPISRCFANFEQRGKLRLGRSKTNRDYLDAMRSEQRIYPTFSVMTNAFEHVWYGQERATEDEFREFVALYQEMVK